MNRDFLKEAIADAKAVKESAIANAKAALEESFTPHLKTMLAAKLYEMEEKETMDDVKEEYDELEEAKEETTESEEGKEMEEGKKMEEPVSEMNLDELLAELEEVDEPTNEELYEAEEAEEDEETVGEIPVSKLESIIADVIQDMMDSGELEKKGESEEEESEEEKSEEEKSEKESKEEVDEELEEILAEIELEEKKHNKEEESSKLDEFLAEIELEEDETEDGKGMKESMKEKDKLEEAYAALKTVKAELNEVNLLNAKLLYTNKIFRSKSLTESQKVKVLTAFDKAINVKEVKLVYESLLENLTTTKKSVNENLLSSASKTISGIKNTKQPIVESNEMVKRFQKLAGIK